MAQLPPPSADDIIADPGASFWLKDALKRAMTRDPVDALGDAILLTRVLSRHVDALMKQPPAQTSSGN